ncbi:hypothetical protein FN846DRAFT_68131 [Sphaerosporella brunnea]|uniref:SET domain-containing protein n=1 Tax=Sphaerosporella brunnea TaxID=1250544 RepID=A0A5J5ETF7_9PEZI|nr:hypothetical protein FN846DRAFT_68131 [Sphaerosporella brunnea]
MSQPLTRISTLNLVLETPKGRGVFATALIPAGTVIDTAPVLLLSERDFDEHVTHTSLLHYSYNWPTPTDDGKSSVLRQAIVLGLGSMFNHSARRQNVGWKRNLEKQVVVYTALRDIAKGEELLISYGPHLTFVDAEEAMWQRGREAESGEDFLGGIEV